MQNAIRSLVKKDGKARIVWSSEPSNSLVGCPSLAKLNLIPQETSIFRRFVPVWLFHMVWYASKWQIGFMLGCMSQWWPGAESMCPIYSYILCPWIEA